MNEIRSRNGAFSGSAQDGASSTANQNDAYGYFIVLSFYVWRFLRNHFLLILFSLFVYYYLLKH